MGVLKFRFSPPDLASRFSDLSKAYVTGLDRTPSRVRIEIQPGLLTCSRENPESVRLHVPWPVEGFGAPFVATATLAERAQPYDLAVELARGRLNEVRNQLSDWVLMGLQPPEDLNRWIVEAQRAFARAATSQDVPEESGKAAQASLSATFRAAAVLAESYTLQVLQKRRHYAGKLPTLLSCGLSGEPKKAPWAASLRDGLSAARIGCSWKTLAPTEGKFRWEELDAQLAWCRSQRLTATAGPLLDLRPGALPDWLWLWQGDFEEIQGMVVDLVRQVLSRYRGKIAVWHLVGRPGSSEILGMTEEQQIRLAAKALQTARNADPNAQLVVDFDRPWGEFMATSPFQLGPLHLADSLARAELGLTGIGLEIAPGFSPPGSHMRDLFDLSRLLDLYALVNLPLHVTLALPSSASPDAAAEVELAKSQWPNQPDESQQRYWASRWVALAVAKPYVRSVNWLQASDAEPHLYPHAGLYRADGSPKPLAGWFKSFREDWIGS